jgi:phage gp29-like protein
MAIKLSPSEMYGHWTHCEPKVCEFQHGVTMIYVSYSNDKPMESRLAVAQATIEAAFKETGDALEFARQISENQNPEFWRNARRIALKQSPLIVFAVRYPLDSDLPIYEISWNPVFEPEIGVAMSEDWIEDQVLIELPENDEVIFLKRLGAQRYEQVA